MKRVLSAAIFLPFFWFIVKPPFHALYEVLVAVGALLALRELYRFASARGQRCHRALGALTAVLIMASFTFAGFDVQYALAFGLLALPLASPCPAGAWGPPLPALGTP